MFDRLRHIGKVIVDKMDYYIVSKKTTLSLDERVIEKEFMRLYKICIKYTLSSFESMYALHQAIEYIVKYRITGDIVECGVCKGGSAMMMALTLQKMSAIDRKIFLYDTYEGMSEPSDKDIDIWNTPAKEQLLKDWSYVPLEEAKSNILSAGYPEQNLIFVKGKVEDTIPRIIPDKISLLRLDTDFYESTYHELCYLFPRISTYGVLIIDDYGHWKGSKEAVDQYLEENNIKILLNRIDYSARIGIKV